MALPRILILAFVTVASIGTTNADELRVATFNVNYANRRGDLVLRAIATANADVICLQETTLQSEEFLRRHLKVEYPEFNVIGHQDRYYAERFAFVSRQPPKDLDFHPPKDGLFGFWCATFTTAQRDIRIVNVHLKPFMLNRDSGVTGIMASVAATEACHQNEIARIIQSLPDDMPVLVVGDFNSMSTFCAPQAMASAGYMDSFASVHDKPDAHPTWHWPTRPIPLRMRVDYIFHSVEFQTLTSQVIAPTGSDHSLLVSELKISEGKGHPRG
ncbi:MAG: endonuclease/exonuclease/phosphatase family protein [Fuerstiella sp.]